MSNDAFDLVIGLGITGQSCVRYLAERGMPVRALDTRAQPPGLGAWRARFADVPLHLGGWRDDWLRDARRLIVSPGIAVSTPEIARQVASGKEVIGDIELFARTASVPVSRISAAICARGVPPGIGTQSSPMPHTHEYWSSARMS